jgi:peptidoglycan-N-acetylglucosamine deacetylase
MEWPDDNLCAVVLSFDFDAEEVWIGEDPANANRPGVLSQGTYGAKRGVPLVLDFLAELDLPAAFYIPGRVAERYPRRVREILAAGHEVGLHGWTHRSPALLSQEEERDELRQSLDVLSNMGAELLGYRSPSWDFSNHTMDLLEEHGVFYSTNMMDDIEPYRHEGRSLIELPVQWILDDAPHYWFDGIASWTKKISTPSELLEIWRGEFEGIRRLGGLCMLTMHPQISGRPSRLAALREFVGYVRTHDDVWLATAAQVAKHADGQLADPGEAWTSREG